MTLPLIIALILLPCIAAAQPKAPVLEVETATVLSSGRLTPFWLISNRQGKISPDQNMASITLAAFAQPDTGKVFDLHYGAEVYGRQGRSGDLWVHQLYAGVTYKDVVELRAGLWEEVIGSIEPMLSSGSTVWSGNARPMPKIQIGTPGYIDLPFTRGYAEGSLLVSHGWFTDDRFASNVWLHHKNTYLRLGGDLPVNVYHGMNHYVQWGGSSPLQERPYPSDLYTFLLVFFSRSGDSEAEGTPTGWAQNKYGNSIGSRSYGIDIKLTRLKTGAYHQDIFEDGSGKRRRNFPDGLWGGYLRFTDKKRLVQAVVYEWLHTKHQSGPTHDDDEGNQVGGNDNYFNHGHYQSGWSFYGFTIGTPFITSPILNDPPNHRFTNNRVLAHHVGITGFFSEKLQYRSLISYSRNYGRHSIPFETPRDQYSIMLEMQYPLPWLDIQAGITLATDIGQMYGDNHGIMIHLKKQVTFQ
jgi:hypothetical protein